MGLLIHNNKLYFDYGLFKIEIDMIADKQFILYNHTMVIDLSGIIILTNSILYILFILFEIGLLFFILNTISICIGIGIGNKYIDNIIYIYPKIINSVCILKPKILYHIKYNYYHDQYYIYQLYDGLSFKKYNKKCKLEIKNELNKYNIKEITNIILQYVST